MTAGHPSKAPTANLSRILDWARYRFPRKVALAYEDRRWTYADMDRDVNALAAGLREAGIAREHRVAVLGQNVPEYLLLGLALAKLGAVMVPLNYRLAEDELAQLLGHCKPVALAADSDFADTARALLDRVPALERLLALEDRPGDPWISVPELIERHSGERVPDAEVGDDDVQRILYTSGTTSLPKGAMLTHGNVNANMNAQVVELALTPEDRILNFAPLYHVGGLDLPGYATWYVGATMLLERRFAARDLLERITNDRATGMVMVATMIGMIRDLPDRERYDTSSVRFLIFSQVNRRLFEEARRLFPNARLIEGYGLTETCNGLTYLDMEHMLTKQGSVGRPLHGVDVQVVDEDDNPLPPGEEGEVVARGPKVCAGYLDDPEATARAFRNGWFHTGDIGRFDEDGYLYIVDRLKDMIRSGGENVASSEIEAVIHEFPAVSETAVVGAPHPKWVEVPVAFVVPRPGQQIDPQGLVAHCREHLAGFKVPKAVYELEALPRNPSGKVLKCDLRDMLGELTPTYLADDQVGRAG